jgi:hypothetical protein
MKQLYRIAIIAALGLAAVTTAHAANNGDVFLGFNDDGSVDGSDTSPADYIIDLGASAATLVTEATAGSGSVNISVNQTTFNTEFNAAFGPASGEDDPLGEAGNNGVNPQGDVAVGAVEGNTSVPTARVLAMTAVGQPVTIGEGNFNPSISSANSIAAQEAASSGGTTFSTLVAQDPNTAGTSANSVAAKSFNNPLQYLSSGSIDNFELYAATQNGSGSNPSAFSALGWFDITVTDTDGVFGDHITFNVPFTPMGGAPEPAMYGILAGAGILVLALRRQFVARTA